MKQKNNVSTIHWRNILFYVATLFLVAFSAWSAFHKINVGFVYDWDEARHGVNAYEMLKHKSYFAHLYDGAIDYWNLKPPLSFWAIMLSYRMFGVRLLGLRFFSALSLPIIVLICMLALRKILGATGAIVSGMLFSGMASRFYHLFQTGDPDALFFLFCFLTCLLLYYAFSASSNFLVGVGLCTSFAFLTKAMHVAPLFVVIGASLLFFRKSKRFSWKDLLLKLVLPMVLPVLLWGLIRFSIDGIEFFKQMLLIDVLSRVGDVVESHTGGYSFYFVVLKNLMGRLQVISLFILFFLFFYAIITKLSQDKKVISNFYFLFIALFMLVIPFVFFTMSKTKLGWYIYPALIGLFFLAGYAAQSIVDTFVPERVVETSQSKYRKSKTTHHSQILRAIVSILISIPFLISLFIYPFEDINYLTSSSSENNVFAALSENDRKANYYSVTAQGDSINLPQSWLLHGIFLGTEHRTDPFQMEKALPADTMLIVALTSQEELDTFILHYPHFNLTAISEHYAVFL